MILVLDMSPALSEQIISVFNVMRNNIAGALMVVAPIALGVVGVMYAWRAAKNLFFQLSGGGPSGPAAGYESNYHDNDFNPYDSDVWGDYDSGFGSMDSGDSMESGYDDGFGDAGDPRD